MKRVVARIMLSAVVASLATSSVALAEAEKAAKLADASRIVSVGAAITETLFALGAGARVVAIDTTSQWPEAAQKLPRVGYLRTLAAEGILSLGPTVVLASAEAGPPSTLTQLRDAGVDVVTVTSTPSADGVRAMIRELADIVAADPTALLQSLDSDLAAANDAAKDAAKKWIADMKSSPSVLFVVQPPGMGTPLAAGTNTPAAAMIELAGARNSVTTLEGYKPLTAEAAVAAAPDVIAVPEGTVARIGGASTFLEGAGLGMTPAGRNGRVVEIPTHVLTLGPGTGRAAIELARLLGAALASVPAGASAMQ